MRILSQQLVVQLDRLQRSGALASIFDTVGARSCAACVALTLPGGAAGLAGAPPGAAGPADDCAGLSEAGTSTSLPSPWTPNCFSMLRSARRRMASGACLLSG